MPKIIKVNAKNFALGLEGKGFVDVFDIEHTFFENKESDEPCIIVNNIELTQDVVLENLSFEYPIYIDSGRFKELSFSCEFVDRLRISGGKFESLNIVGGRFRSSLSINGGEFEDFSFHGGVFDITTTISAGYFANGITFTNSIFNDALLFLGGEFKKSIVFFGGEFTNSVLFAGGQVRKVSFEGGSFHKAVCFSGSDLKCVSVKGGVFNKIKTLDSAVIKVFVVQHSVLINFPIFLSGTIDRLYLMALLAANGSIYINDLFTDTLRILKFVSKGIFDVNRLFALHKGAGNITIRNSDLGHAIFKETNFSSFQTIHVSNSRLHNITTIGGYFPSHLDIGSKQNKPSEPERSAEAYNQLTLAMQKQGNRDKEVEYYTSYLDWQRKAYLKSKKWSAAGSLWLHKVSTEYGSSWIRGALLTLFVVSPACYFLYSLTLPGVCCQFFQEGWESGVSLHIKYFLTFLLPTHSLDFVQGIKLGWDSYALDIFGRIVIGFMIYQTIAAFRRYGKV